MGFATTSVQRTTFFSRSRRIFLVASGFLLATTGVVVDAQVAAAIPATGITYYVNSAGDLGATDCNVPNNTDCGIDDAIRAFNGDTTTNDADTIVFSSLIPTFYVSVPTEISNSTSGITLAINGNGVGNTAVSGELVTQVFNIDVGTVTISGLTIEDGNGGIGGGGVSNSVFGTVTLTDDTLSGDSAVEGGGVNNGGIAYLTDDTLADNQASDGGGVFNSGTVTLTDDTLSGNTATYGGGVLNGGSNIANLTDDTLSGNTATYGAGVLNSGTAPIANSILDDGSGECSGSVTDGGYNVEADDSCFGTDSDDVENSTDINLASSLAANGSTGPETFAIGPDSSAYEEVPTSYCSVTTDERGDSRPGVSGANCDAGAYEYQMPATPCPAGSYNATNGDTPCTTTPAGNYDTGTGNTAPTPCPSGTYNPNTGSTSSTDCVAAPAGTYDAGTGNSAATPCPAGTYNPSIGSTMSTACTTTPAGSYDVGTGNTEPVPCPAGTYDPNTGSTSSTACMAAPNDTYDAGTGNSEPTPCPAYTSNVGTGNTSCTASTTLTYTGTDQVAIGSTYAPTATLTSPVAACESGQPVTFSLTPDPLNGSAGPYTLETVNSSPTGVVTGTAVSTKGWENGVYTVTVSYPGTTTGTVLCAPASTTASLAVTAPGQFAFGYGWYTPSSTVGPTSFGFVVSQTIQTRGRTTTTSYSGQLDAVTPGKWWFQANVTSFGLTSSTQALLAGTGTLYWWNTTLNKGHGGWQLAKSNVSYKATANATTKTSPGSFGVTISYMPVPPQPAALPNSPPVTLTKGGIFIT